MSPYSFSKPKIRRLRGVGCNMRVQPEYQPAPASSTEAHDPVTHPPQAAKTACFPRGYVEDFDEPRTLPAGFFSSRLCGEELFGIRRRQTAKFSAVPGAIKDRHFQTLQR